MWFATCVGTASTGWTSRRRNPLTGLCGLQLKFSRRWVLTFPPGVAIPLRGYVVCNDFGEIDLVRALYDRVAIPLRGYVVCNGNKTARGERAGGLGRNPLTGLCGLQLSEDVGPPLHGILGRNPLTGLCGLQRFRMMSLVRSSASMSQSPYGAMWFATPSPSRFLLDVDQGSQSPYGAMWFATHFSQVEQY